MPETRKQARKPRDPNRPPCASWHQLFKLACTMSEMLELDPPKSREAASALIDRLENARQAESTSTDTPF